MLVSHTVYLLLLVCALGLVIAVAWLGVSVTPVAGLVAHILWSIAHSSVYQSDYRGDTRIDRDPQHWNCHL